MHKMDLVIADLAARQHGLFTREQALVRGATPNHVKVRLRHGLWIRHVRGVYRLAGHAPTWRQSVMAACLYYGGWASHRTAGELKGLASVPRHDEIELIVARVHRRTRPGVKLYGSAESLDAADTEMKDGIPMTSPARTLFDLAAVLSPEHLEEALDDALNRRLVTPTRMKWQLSKCAGSGRKGTILMRALLADRTITDAIHESPPETRFARILRDMDIAAVPQFKIHEGGKEIARVDFALPEVRLAIEVDGFSVHGKRSQWERDVEREERVKMAHWDLVHVTAGEVSERPDVVKVRVLAAIARARRSMNAR